MPAGRGGGDEDAAVPLPAPPADPQEQGRQNAAAWLDAMRWEDVMVPYSDWVGDWSDYHGGNRWQALNGGHRAAGDCRAVLDCLRGMAQPSSAEEDPWETTDTGGWGSMDHRTAIIAAKGARLTQEPTS